MIYKKETSEFMNSFDKANEILSTAVSTITDIKNTIDKQLKLITVSNMYFNDKISAINSTEKLSSNKIVLVEAEKVMGLYDEYGISLLPHLSKTPVNICNFYTGDEYIFKDNINITINGNEDTELKNILIHDSINSKEIYFNEYDTNEIIIDIKAPSAGILGSMKMNTIEIHPYLAGSFDIKSIDVYEVGEDSEPAHQITDIVSVARARYVLDSRVTLSHITFTIKLKYRNPETNKYVFGLKHIYLLDATYDESSYAVIKITKDTDIEYIYNRVYLGYQGASHAQFDADDLGIKFYAACDNGILSREITLSTDADPSYISSNTKTVYMYLPIYTSYISVTPDIRTNINND